MSNEKPTPKGPTQKNGAGRVTGGSRQKRWADAQAQAGKCRQCGKPAVTKHHCQACAEKHRARSAAWMRKARAKHPPPNK